MVGYRLASNAQPSVLELESVHRGDAVLDFVSLIEAFALLLFGSTGGSDSPRLTGYADFRVLDK